MNEEKRINDIIFDWDSSTSSDDFDDDIADPNFEIVNNNDSDLDGILCLNSDDEDEHAIVDLNGPTVIEDSNDEMDNINEPSTLTGIKRKKCNRSLWNRNVEKKKITEGIEFISNYKNKVIQKRQIGVDYKCPLNCFSKFNEKAKK